MRNVKLKKNLLRLTLGLPVFPFFSTLNSPQPRINTKFGLLCVSLPIVSKRNTRSQIFSSVHGREMHRRSGISPARLCKSPSEALGPTLSSVESRLCEPETKVFSWVNARALCFHEPLAFLSKQSLCSGFEGAKFPK